MYKTLTIIGTRPEAIKTAILHKLLLENEKFDPVLLSTGQHKTLLTQALNDFDISEFHQLGDDIPDISVAGKCSIIIGRLDNYISTKKPDLIIVQGDT
ncbi:MAG: UDP-N-acetylglucosamine 2-epimerase, partial [Bacteroidia bacterium]|nr:UDP-N-acetylglucosamine 2-epimerase [Bacteroidia bacterium]